MDATAKFDWKIFLFSFEGRATRSDYWVRFQLAYLAAIAAGAIIDAIIGFNIFTALAMLAGFWSSLAILVRRCHDRGRSGWFILVGLVPLLNFWYIIEVLFLRGTVGPNAYGADPLA